MRGSNTQGWRPERRLEAPPSAPARSVSLARSAPPAQRRDRAEFASLRTLWRSLLVVGACGVLGACAGESRAAAADGGALAEGDGGSALTLPPYRERVVPVPGAALDGAPAPSRGPAGADAAPGRTLDVARGRPAAAPVAGSANAAPPSPAEPDGQSAEIDARALGREVEAAVARALDRATKARRGDYDRSATVVGVSVVDLATGRTLVDRLGSTALRPASNMKVVTAAAALLGLGPDAAFETRFEAGGKVADGALEGDIIVRAGADPLHRRDGDGSLDPWLDALARDLRTAGVERIRGRLLLDEGTFETPGPAVEWPDASQHWQAYCGLAGGFSANGGVFRVTVKPGAKGRAAGVVLRPRDHGLEERIGVTSTGTRNAVRIGATATTATVGGSIPASAPDFVEEFRHPDPVELFGHVILGGLTRRGIAFDQPVFVRQRGALSTGTVLHTMKSPITTVLEAILLDSNNPVTDQLFYLVGERLGGAGTREASARAIRTVMREHGVDAASLVQADGSGLSKANRISADALVQTLQRLRRSNIAAWRTFVAALPTGGESGSLARRMAGTPAEGRVRAKTGWIAGASALSGVVVDRTGEAALAFSILVDYPRVGGLNNAAWKPMQDEMCVALVEALDRAAGGER